MHINNSADIPTEKNGSCVSRDKLYEIIKNLFIFNGIDDNSFFEKNSVRENFHIRHCTGKEKILCEDKETHGIYIVIKGRCVIESGNSTHPSIIRYVEENETFGAASVFSGDSFHKTAVYSAGKSTVGCFSAEYIRSLISEDPRISFNCLAFLSEKITFLNNKIAAFTAGSAEEKLAVFLLSEKDNNGTVLIKRGYSSLADMLCIGRASLYRILEKFENDGIIIKDKNTISISNADRLDNILKNERT